MQKVLGEHNKGTEINRTQSLSLVHKHHKTPTQKIPIMVAFEKSGI